MRKKALRAQVRAALQTDEAKKPAIIAEDQEAIREGIALDFIRKKASVKEKKNIVEAEVITLKLIERKEKKILGM